MKLVGHLKFRYCSSVNVDMIRQPIESMIDRCVAAGAWLSKLFKEMIDIDMLASKTVEYHVGGHSCVLNVYVFS